MKKLFNTLIHSIAPAAVVAAGLSTADAQEAPLIVKGSESKSGAICYNWPTLREKVTDGFVRMVPGGTTKVCVGADGKVGEIDPATVFNTQNVVCVVTKRSDPHTRVPMACPNLNGPN